MRLTIRLPVYKMLDTFLPNLCNATLYAIDEFSGEGEWNKKKKKRKKGREKKRGRTLENNKIKLLEETLHLAVHIEETKEF